MQKIFEMPTGASPETRGQGHVEQHLRALCLDVALIRIMPTINLDLNMFADGTSDCSRSSNN